ncbi:MAG: FliA/WhiG family RNA polymerase sigma factor [Firmicutes bacterium]|nr:FliA/WhiG family RNA polymerase sigma factor [Bacillota bacterium]
MIGVMEKSYTLDDEKRKLVQEHLHLVKKIASKLAIFLPRHIDHDDLIHEGIMGLMDAASRYNPRCGMSFANYATIRVKGSIIDSLRAMDWIPRRVRKMAKVIEKTKEELTQELQRTPSSQEISDKLNLPVDKINEIISAAEQSQLLSFEDLQSFSNRYYIPEDKVTSVQPEDAISDYERVEIKSALKMALMELSEREKLVLALYYIEDLTLKEMKLVLNISEARISQIHTVAIKKLKEKLEELRAAKSGIE